MVTPARARAFLEAGCFRILSLEAESAAEARRADLQSRQAPTRLKGVLGISEHLVTIVAERAS